MGCRYNLYLDVDSRRNVTLPPDEPWDVTSSCVLDVAEEGPQDLREIAKLMHLSAERVRQIEVSVLYKIRRARRFDRLR